MSILYHFVWNLWVKWFILLIAEILHQLTGRFIPLFIGFQHHPRWLARFQPSTVRINLWLFFTWIFLKSTGVCFQVQNSSRSSNGQIWGPLKWFFLPKKQTRWAQKPVIHGVVTWGIITAFSMAENKWWGYNPPPFITGRGPSCSEQYRFHKFRNFMKRFTWWIFHRNSFCNPDCWFFTNHFKIRLIMPMWNYIISPWSNKNMESHHLGDLATTLVIWGWGTLQKTQRPRDSLRAPEVIASTICLGLLECQGCKGWNSMVSNKGGMKEEGMKFYAVENMCIYYIYISRV